MILRMTLVAKGLQWELIRKERINLVKKLGSTRIKINRI